MVFLQPSPWLTRMVFGIYTPAVRISKEEEERMGKRKGEAKVPPSSSPVNQKRSEASSTLSLDSPRDDGGVCSLLVGGKGFHL